MQDELEHRSRFWAWVATVITVGAYFALMVCVAVMPEGLAQPLVAGGTISVALLFGVLVIAICIGTSALYTHWSNSRSGRR